jgi:hypothetical protein
MILNPERVILWPNRRISCWIICHYRPPSYWQATSNAAFECWFAYGPYRPVMVGKLLDIFRVFHNFVEVGGNKQTKSSFLCEVPNVNRSSTNSEVPDGCGSAFFMVSRTEDSLPQVYRYHHFKASDLEVQRLKVTSQN